jgi:acyl dehydratase
MYAGASGDFNPIHTVDEFAQKVGLDGVIAHGMLTMAFVGQLLTDLLGSEGELHKFGVRFTGMVRPGDVITCEGRVVEVIQEEKMQTALCDVWAVTQNGEKVLNGQAEFAVPIA